MSWRGRRGRLVRRRISLFLAAGPAPDLPILAAAPAPDLLILAAAPAPDLPILAAAQAPAVAANLEIVKH